MTRTGLAHFASVSVPLEQDYNRLKAKIADDKDGEEIFLLFASTLVSKLGVRPETIEISTSQHFLLL